MGEGEQEIQLSPEGARALNPNTPAQSCSPGQRERPRAGGQTTPSRSVYNGCERDGGQQHDFGQYDNPGSL